MTEGTQSYELPARYTLQIGDKTRLELPVHVVDVDDLHIWLRVDRDAHTQWMVGVSWSRIVGELLDEPIEDLLREMEEQKIAPEEGGD